MRPAICSKPDALPAPRPDSRRLRFREVSFVYPGSSRAILERLDLRIAPGERIALVGENGQGKTTIVKLLTRLYDPTEGRILLDGVDLREYSVEDLHRQIGVIFQDFVRYEMTARQNIAVGRHRGPQERRDAPGRAQELGRPRLWRDCRAATTRSSAGASKAAWTSRAASGRRWRWRAPICATRRS